MGSRKIGIPGEVRWIRQVANTRIGKNLSPVYHVGIAVFREDVQPEWNELVEECASEPGPSREAGEPIVKSKPTSLPVWDAISADTPAD
jgi:hypothetical protein